MPASQRRKAFWWTAGIGAATAGALILYFFPPADHRFYPKCVLHLVTGLACPGCGSLRAAHSLMHGDFAAAFRFNPLIFLLLPLGGLAWIVYRPAGLTAVPPKWIWALLAVIIAFGVLRNVPVPPFTYLYP